VKLYLQFSLIFIYSVGFYLLWSNDLLRLALELGRQNPNQ